MRRRLLLTGLGGTAFVTAVTNAHAQTASVWHIGALTGESPEPFLTRLKSALKEVGYVDGENIRIQLRATSGREDQLRSFAADLVRQPVDLIVARLTPAVLAARAATHSIPIVMAGAGDPVGTGLVASLASPGGNVTGAAGLAGDLAGKLVEIIRDMLPACRRVAVLANPVDRFTKPFLSRIQFVAGRMGFEVATIMIGSEAELAPAFQQMRTDRTDAVIVQPSLPRRTAIRFAQDFKLPTASPIESFTKEGGVLAYASSISETFRNAALYVDKILKGSKPGDLPVTQSTRFELSINLAAARTIGLTIPQSLLVRADEVIE